MPKFLVPHEIHPGVFRQGVGFFPPGSEIELPDAASSKGDVPSAKLIPKDEAGRQWLQSIHDAAHVRAVERLEAAKKAKEAGAGVLPRATIGPPMSALPEQDTGDTGPESLRELGERTGEVPVGVVPRGGRRGRQS